MIEQNIPIPPKSLQDFVDRMEIGESILIPEKQRFYAYNAFRRRGVKCTMRKEGDGRRVWRTE